MQIIEEKEGGRSGIAPRFSKLSRWKWLVFAAILMLPISIAAPKFLHVILWSIIVLVGDFSQQFLEPGNVPVYQGARLTLNDGKVVGIVVGSDEEFPKHMFIQVGEQVRDISQLTVSDAISLGMNAKPSSLTSLQYAKGTLYHKSFVNFDNGKVSAFYGCHSDFKFSKTADGPFFSLPIGFDEYQKIFGKPLRWKREVSGKRVP